MTHPQNQKPTGLVIAGHPRSGTTILNRLLNYHKEITLSFEFSAFWNIGMPHEAYVETLRKTWQTRRLVNGGESLFSRFRQKALSRKFFETFMSTIDQYSDGIIGYEQIMEAYQKALPGIPIVGDKVPRYIFILDRLVKVPELKKIIIYRNCPNVARSCMEMSQTKWAGKINAEQYGTAEKVAHTWMKAIAIMEEYRDQIFIIRYEDLIRNPQKEAARIGEYLNISPAGFRTDTISSDRSKKHSLALSGEDQEIIREIAGPTMERLGYL